jgi:hypothetical protein
MSYGPTETVPNNVLLFSGHMIDAPGRSPPRFPPDKEAVAATAIADTILKIGAGPQDIGICGAACGGDLLFAEACRANGISVELYIPFDEPTFLASSVDFAKADWHDRYLSARSAADLHVMPDELGPLPPGENAYERNNRWMLEAAARFGDDKIAAICLWNGQAGDGPGGARHFLHETRRRTARVYWLDTTRLWD